MRVLGTPDDNLHESRPVGSPHAVAVGAPRADEGAEVRRRGAGGGPLLLDRRSGTPRETPQGLGPPGRSRRFMHGPPRWTYPVPQLLPHFDPGVERVDDA